MKRTKWLRKLCRMRFGQNIEARAAGVGSEKPCNPMRPGCPKNARETGRLHRLTTNSRQGSCGGAWLHLEYSPFRVIARHDLFISRLFTAIKGKTLTW